MVGGHSEVALERGFWFEPEVPDLIFEPAPKWFGLYRGTIAAHYSTVQQR